MTKEEKLEAIADILEVGTEELSENMVLEEFDTWDSVAVLSVIAVINEKFERFPLAEEILQYKTIGDLLKAFE